MYPSSIPIDPPSPSSDICDAPYSPQPFSLSPGPYSTPHRLPNTNGHGNEWTPYSTTATPYSHVSSSPPASSPASHNNNNNNGGGGGGSNSNSNSSNITVSIRLRPIPAAQPVWAVQGNTISDVSDQFQKSYSFNYVCGPNESTSELYKNLIRPAVLKACVGYNSNVFAYGQTASGKTFTTLGNESSPGIVLLGIGDIFHSISQTPNRQFLLRVSCIEIYNETINDLLSSSPSGRDLKLEEITATTAAGGASANAKMADMNHVKIKGLTQEFIRNPAEFIALLMKAEENKKIASTDANLHSSRSHTMFRVHIESRSRNKPQMKNGKLQARKIRSSLLTFIDLAGSECISQLGGSVERQKECRHINRSLLGLSRVIVKLSSNDPSHVPYRDSRLTRILRPALGGNSYTIFICCLNPSLSCREESHNTLRFGSFANQIVNTAKINIKEEKVREDIKAYQQMIRDMQERMELARRAEQAELEELRLRNEQLKKMLQEREQDAMHAQHDALLASEAAMNATQAAKLAEEQAEKERQLAQSLFQERQRLEALRNEQDTLRMEEQNKHMEERNKHLEDEKRAQLNSFTQQLSSMKNRQQDESDRETDELRFKLHQAEQQIKLLEERLYPMIDEVEGKRADEDRLRELMSIVNELRNQNLALEAARDKEKSQYELDRKQIEEQKAKLLSQYLDETMNEQKKLEARIRKKEEDLQLARLIAMKNGMDVQKCNLNTPKTHLVRLRLNDSDNNLYWKGNGIGKSEKKMLLNDIEQFLIGQNTPAFQRNEAIHTPIDVMHSFSLVTSKRTLDIICPSDQAFLLWVEGLKNLLRHASVLDSRKQKTRLELDQQRASLTEPRKSILVSGATGSNLLGQLQRTPSTANANVPPSPSNAASSFSSSTSSSNTTATPNKPVFVPQAGPPSTPTFSPAVEQLKNRQQQQQSSSFPSSSSSFSSSSTSSDQPPSLAFPSSSSRPISLSVVNEEPDEKTPEPNGRNIVVGPRYTNTTSFI